MAHVHAQVVRGIDIIRSPNLLENLAVGDDFAGVFDQRGEQAVFDRREMDLVLADEDLTALLIDAEVVDTEDGLARLALAGGGVAKSNAQSRQEFAHAE